MHELRLSVLFALLLVSSATAAYTEVFEKIGPAASSAYGFSIEVDGSHAVIGSYGHTDPANYAGAVEFWRLVGGVWTPQGLVLSPNGTSSGQFGWDVSVTAYSDDLAYAAVGAVQEDATSANDAGLVHIYKFSGGSWAWSRTIEASDASSVGRFGGGVAIRNNRLVVGSHAASGSAGRAYFYTRDGSDDWTEETKINGESGGDLFGWSVALSGSGDIAIVAASQYDEPAGSDNVGRVYTYKRSVGGTWSLQQTIVNPTPFENEFFGTDVAADGDYLIISAPSINEGSLNAEVRIYDLQGGDNYVFKSRFTSEHTSYGRTADIDAGGFAVVGDPTVIDEEKGRAYVYERNGDGSWGFRETVNVSAADLGSVIGRDIAYSGEYMFIGGYGHDLPEAETGAVWVFIEGEAPPSTPDTENPLRCGDYDEDNSRYFYDDGTGCETTPTVNDACYYSVSELTTSDAATLRDDLSELKADEGTDYIYLSFDLADKYYSSEMVFADATAGQCTYAAWNLVSATRNVTDLDACYTTFVYRLPWTDAYNATDSKCGWVRDTSGANVKLTLDFAVRAVEDLTAMRNGTTITRTSEFAMPVQVEFPVQVVADADDVQVFAPVRVIAAIVGQAVTIDESTSPDTATLTLRLSTEVQKPFELHAITSESHPVDVTLATTLNGANDANVRKDAECTNSALDCGNEWEWTYSTQTTAEPCDFDGAYSVSFTIRCSDENDTDCPIDDATDSVTISFNVDSSDHCPKVIDSIVLSAALEVFDAPQRVTAADDFVGDGLQDDGQTAVNEGDTDQWQVAYFTAPTTSTQVALDTTEFNQVWIVRDGADDIILLDKDNSQGSGVVSCTATAYADADNTASCGTEAGLDSTTCQLIVPDIAFPDKCGAFDFAHRPGTSADAGDDSIPWFEFDINTGASGFNLDDDAIETMTVHAVIDVTYTNAAKRVAGSIQETRADFATVAAPLTAGTATSSTGSTSTSSSALFGMNATVLYGAGAFLALAVLAVVVVVSRRRSTPNITKLQSTTELASTNAV